MIVRGRVVTPERVVAGTVRVAGTRIAEIDPGGPGDGHWIVPGFVDIHNHGGGGHAFSGGDAGARRAAAFHLRHGTTSVLASLVSSPWAQLRSDVATLAPLVTSGVLAGIHLEGPYLSPARRGAHHPDHLRAPSAEELSDLLDLGGDAVRMVTLAPELAGAGDTIAMLAGRGVVTAIGHTDATYAQTRAAVATGARVATHLGNAMRPVHQREPGPVVALLAASTVVCEVIADGVHLHDGMLAFVTATAGADRVALVTDATEAAGMPDGTYQLGGRPVIVSAGTARLATGDDGSGQGSPGPIAGSTLTIDAALRRVRDVGVSMVDAVRMAATTPARVLGLGGTVGALSVGLQADLVELDHSLRVVRVMRAGSWVAP